jgi:hypothetical protein
MAEPFTIGAAVAWALSTVAEAVLKTLIGEAVKDAYQALKQKLLPSAELAVKLVEDEPSSEPRQLVLAEIVNKLPVEHQEILKELASKLIDACRQDSHAFGVLIERSKTKNIDFANFVVNEGIGARISESQTDNVTARGFIVGRSMPGKS